MIHNAQHLSTLLEDLYPTGSWAHAKEVGLPCEEGGTRRVDHMVWGIKPRTGYEVIGFEVKVSRSDLLSELKDGVKRRAAMRVCDRFFLVVGHNKLVEPSELPKDWGLIAPVADKTRDRYTLETTLHAPLLHDHTGDNTRPPIARPVIASFISRLTHDPDAAKNHLGRRLREEREKGHREGFNEGLRLGKKKALDEVEINLP